MTLTTTSVISVEILGVPVSLLDSYDHAVQAILGWIRQGAKTYCVAINPEKIHRAGIEPELWHLIRQANLHICDGIGASVAARLLHGMHIRRITGVQLFIELMAAAERESLSVFLLGASCDSNDGARKCLERRYPGLRIVGNQDGYFRDSERVVHQINRSRADMLFVALGSPRQERWIAEHRDAINASFCMGVGGTFDVLSGHAKRAPRVFRKTGTEFLYRLATNPRRWKRQLCLPFFVFSVIQARLFGARQHTPSPSVVVQPQAPHRIDKAA